jgi:hypothetical protein
MAKTIATDPELASVDIEIEFITDVLSCSSGERKDPPLFPESLYGQYGFEAGQALQFFGDHRRLDCLRY